MKAGFFFIFYIGICMFLASCSNPLPAPDPQQEQEVLMKQLAADTGMQLAIENSYEFRKNLVWTTQQAYDVVAGGSPSAGGRWFVLSINKNGTDTIWRSEHPAKMTDALLSDPDGNRSPEIFLCFKDGWQVLSLSNPPSLLPSLALNQALQKDSALLNCNLNQAWIETGKGRRLISIQNNKLSISSPNP